MSTIPKKNAQAIAWVQTRVPVWAAAGATIGVDAQQIGQLGALAGAAATALAEYDAAVAVARAKGEAYRDAVGTMRESAGGQVGRIRGFARTAPNPSAVYAAAQIPPPATPAPSPAPGSPEGFRISLEASGSLRFAFKAVHPAKVKGVTYLVQRQDTPQGPFQFFKLAKQRTFTDNSFPATSSTISYMVTAQTATKSGQPATVTVRYGGGNQGPVIVSQGPAVDTSAA